MTAIVTGESAGVQERIREVFRLVWMENDACCCVLR